MNFIKSGWFIALTLVMMSFMVTAQTEKSIGRVVKIVGEARRKSSRLKKGTAFLLGIMWLLAKSPL